MTIEDKRYWLLLARVVAIWGFIFVGGALLLGRAWGQSIDYRGEKQWQRLQTGSAGQVLDFSGSGTPSWIGFPKCEAGWTPVMVEDAAALGVQGACARELKKPNGEPLANPPG